MLLGCAPMGVRGNKRLQIVFVLLAHNAASLVARVARTMTSTGHRMVIHYDAKVADDEVKALEASLSDLGDRVRFARRVEVGWGEWSVVQATLNAIEAIAEAGWSPDYVYLMSATDYPIRAAADLDGFLERNRGDEFIESVPSDTVKWVKSGPQRERYQYRWYFNWREQPRLTDRLFRLQRRLGLKRRFVGDMVAHLGSQWWVLSWPTLQAIMEIARRPEVLAFFRTTLVPDELFFQTLVRQVVPDHRIINCPLTLYQFTDYGYPVVYHTDHLDYLTRQRFFMARKLSSHDMGLRDLLDPYWRGEKTAKAFIDEDVGLRSTEYEDWRLAHREGPPNRPIAGGGDRGWAAHRRVAKPCFAVLGTSTAELGFAHRVLSRAADVRLHGQLFHPAAIEFADRAASFASYGEADVEMRNMSGVDFLTDVVRAEPERSTGFLLRAEQGGSVAEELAARPDVRMVVLGGDPLVAFSEVLAGPLPALGAAFDAEVLAEVPPEAAAHRFRVFLKGFGQQGSASERRFKAAVDARPKGWVQKFDPRRIGPDWLSRLETCLGLRIDITPEALEAERVAAVEDYRARRRGVIDLLVRGGIDPVVFDVLGQGASDVSIALALL